MHGEVGSHGRIPLLEAEAVVRCCTTPGGMRVPKEILNGPGTLSDEEWQVTRRHPGDAAREGCGGGGA